MGARPQGNTNQKGKCINIQLINAYQVYQKENADETGTVVSEKYILVLQWLWAASKEDEIVAPFPTSAAIDPRTIAWAQRVAVECLVFTAGRE